MPLHGLGSASSTTPAIILLTATVHPHTTTRLTLGDPRRRQAQYNESVRHWLQAQQEHGFRLALADNSPAGSHVDFAIPDQVSTDITILRLPQEAAPSMDKGGREAILLEQAVEAIDPSPDSWIIKCTGRLWLRNPHAVLEDLNDCQIVARATADMHYVDSRIFKVRRRFWDDYLRRMAPAVSEGTGTYLEHVLGRRLSEARARGQNVGRFRSRPRLQGQSGTTGATYGKPSDALRGMIAAPYEALLRQTESRKQY